jgi:probable rRNA maturation factor
MELLIRNQWSPQRPPRRRPLSRNRVESLVTALLRREGRNTDVELSVLFCDDPVIQSLNRDYRGIDQPTDVLSFSQQESVPGEPGLRMIQDAPQPLGDVVISLETAQRQAATQKHSLSHELEWLLLHGVLHLLGYDDTTEDGLQDMIARQTALLLTTPAASRQPRRREATRAASEAARWTTDD